MNFHLEFTPRPFPVPVKHADRLLLIGSCFTENMGAKLKQHKFRVLENPHGILFNPVSIAKSISSYIKGKKYTAGEVFFQNEGWNSWDHHSRFSNPNLEDCLSGINRSQEKAHEFILSADWIMVTAGSAFVYELEEGSVVANCHKVPTDKFHKRLLTVAETAALLKNMLREIAGVNPSARVIFTISPVRHLRDGFVENNRSKSTLLQAIHEVVDTADQVFYFPAYELVIDDLRDYRFYAEDMVHPNYAATNYVWEKFMAACMDDSTRNLMKEINTLNAARNHRPFNPSSEKHRKFLQANLAKTAELGRQFPYIDFEEELQYFKGE